MAFPADLCRFDSYVLSLIYCCLRHVSWFLTRLTFPEDHLITKHGISVIAVLNHWGHGQPASTTTIGSSGRSYICNLAKRASNVAVSDGWRKWAEKICKCEVLRIKSLTSFTLCLLQTAKNPVATVETECAAWEMITATVPSFAKRQEPIAAFQLQARAARRCSAVEIDSWAESQILNLSTLYIYI